MWTYLAPVAGMLLLASLPAAGLSVMIDRFRAVESWSVNPDGGFIEIRADAENTRGGNPSMRLVFTRASHEYGNAARPVKLPPNAIGVEFDLCVHSVNPGAGLSVWLFEADGDGHHAWVKPGGKSFSELEKGWYQCFVPLTSFRFDARGNRRSELLTVNKLLIGINAAAGDVSVANLAFGTVERAKDENKASEAPRPAAPSIEDGARGRVAILQDSFEHRPGDSDPAVLASALRKNGYGVTMLAGAHLADASILTSGKFDCLVLPYGARYPQAASDSVRAYMEAGGCIVTTGGYAFDEPWGVVSRSAPASQDLVVTAEDIASNEWTTPQMNTRRGRPDGRMTSGTLTHMWPDQIALFDPGYHLKHGVRLVSASGQSATPGIDIRDVRVEGYAACSMLGSNDPVFPEKWGRHVPLVDLLDSRGRLVGSAGAIAHNYAGHYAGSSWAFFGVTNMDLFAEGSPMIERLPAIVDAVIDRVYLHSLQSDFACYADGETVKLSCTAANLGRKDAAAAVRFRVYDRAGRQVWESGASQVTLGAGASEVVSAEFAPGRFTDDLYRVTAEMSIDGRQVDLMETGFAAYQPEVTAAGLMLRLNDNYFHDGDRPVLLSGTNVTGSVFFSGNEDPLVWDRDLARMRECGLNIIRVLHFSPFLSDKPSMGAIRPIDLGVDRLPPATERKLDALVQLCQKHKVVMFLTIHDWMHAELSNEELAAQRKYAKLIASRYRDAPGFMIDVENEPMLPLLYDARPGEQPDAVAAWNDYLRAKYGTDEALRAAWSMAPPEAPIGSVPYRAGTGAWEDMRTYDADFFRSELANRWLKANSLGAKEGDPDVLVTVGFLQEHYAVNKTMCMQWLDFANMHSYTSMDILRCDMKLFDRRFEGKSLSLGEFGSVQDYQMRTSGQDSPNQDYPRYLLTGHYVFGLGGSFTANWCWKDAEDVIFPWGINYSCGGPPKDTLKAYRNLSLLMRQVRPAYVAPEVFLVLPSGQMIGEQRGKMAPTFYQVVESLLGAQAQFGTIDDRSLSQLPASAKLLIYPAPFAVPDDAYEHLKSFVRRGGTLCVTGDVSYDQLRRRTLTARLTELCGVRFVSENYPNIAWGPDGAPCISVEPAGASPRGGMYVRGIGKGEVRFTPRPMGVMEKPGEYIFTEPLAAIARATINTPGAHAFRVDESGGGQTIILVNPGSAPKTIRLSEPGCEPVEVSLQGIGMGMVRFGRLGKVVAVESQGPVTVAGMPIPLTGHAALVACDGRSLLESHELMIIPFGGCEVDLSALPGVEGAVVQGGEVAGGMWTPLSESTDLRISAAREIAFDIHLAAVEDRLPALGRFVASEMMLGRR